MENKIISFSKEIIRTAAKSLMITGAEYEGVINGGVYPGMPVDASSYHGGGPGMWFFGNNSFSFKFNYNSNSDARLAYECCAPLAAIINKKAKSYINGKTWVMNAKGKARGKESESPDALKIRKLMKRPNPVQSWKQFEAQQEIYIDLFGFSILMPIFPFGRGKDGDLIDASSMWNIPATMIDIKETKQLFLQQKLSGILESIVLNYKGVKTILNLDSLHLFKDFTPNFDSLIFPESRLCALEIQINNIIGCYESRSVLISRRGAMGILSNGAKDTLGTIAIDDQEKKDLQAGFSSYGLRQDQWQVIVTNAALQWQQMGYPTKDLMLFEEIEDDIQRICDSYDFPFRLLSSNESNSLGGTDAGIFTKNLYQDAIIPQAENIYEQWNNAFKTEDRGLDIQKDYSHVPCLQSDKVQEGQARLNWNQAQQIEWLNNLITRNQWLEQNGLDTIGPDGDLYYYQMIQQGLLKPAAPAGPPNQNPQS